MGRIKTKKFQCALQKVKFILIYQEWPPKDSFIGGKRMQKRSQLPRISPTCPRTFLRKGKRKATQANTTSKTSQIPYNVKPMSQKKLLALYLNLYNRNMNFHDESVLTVS